MKINYPIKYAAMPIIEQIGWSPGLHDLEREYGIVCYIVSKCYLIRDTKIFKENGHTINEYEVVFPYQHSNFYKWKREIPTYNAINGNGSNSNKVDIIFDTYEEALNYTTAKNEELCKKSWVYLPYSEDFMKKVQEKKDSFKEKLEEYKLLEKQIMLNTEDMDPKKIKELTKAIRVQENVAKIPTYDVDIYEFLKVYSDQDFIIYSLSLDQYNNLINIIKEDNMKKINTINNSIPEVILHTKDNNLNKITKQNFKKIDKNILTFYTTEPIDDLLNSHQEYPEIKLNEIQEKVLKKTK